MTPPHPSLTPCLSPPSSPCLPGPMDGAVAPHKVGQWGLLRWGRRRSIVGVGVSRWGHRDWSMGNKVGGINAALSRWGRQCGVVRVGVSRWVCQGGGIDNSFPSPTESGWTPADSSRLHWTLPDRA
jgi:hypothetical protein